MKLLIDALNSRSRSAPQSIMLFVGYVFIRFISTITRGSAIAKGPRVSGRLHWRLSQWIICSWTNESFWNIRLYSVSWPWNSG